MINQYTHENKDAIESDTLFKLLSQDLEEAFKQHCWYFKEENVFGKLRNLIKRSLTDSELIELARPWVRGLQLVYIIENINVTDEKNQAEAVCSAIKNLRNFLNRSTPPRDKLRFIAESKLLDYTQAHQALDNIEEHAAFFLSQKFKNGADLNLNYIKRYAIYCLFYIGKNIGLNKVGSPSPLYQFVKIITQFDTKEVSNYYSGYIKTTIQNEANKNSILRFIYNPPEVHHG